MPGRITVAWKFGMLPAVSPKNSDALSCEVSTLTARIARGDEDAFQAFYEVYSPQIFRFLRVLVRGNEDLAEELHQQVMIKTARKMRCLQDEDQLWRWLAQVARNTWRDLLRQQRREGEGLDLFKLASGEGATEPLDLTALWPALESLPENQRALIRSFYLERVKQKDISLQTGLSVKAIQSELARIRKKLRALIERRRNGN